MLYHTIQSNLKSSIKLRNKYRDFGSFFKAAEIGGVLRLGDIHTVRQQLGLANAHSQIALEAPPVARGARQGDPATARKSMSDLTKIQEEIGNAVGKFADKRTLGQAKIRQGAGVSQQAIKRIGEYLDRLPDAPREAKLRSLVKELQSYEDALTRNGSSSGSNLDPQDVLQALSAQSKDARQQYMLLQGARVHFENRAGSNALLPLLDGVEKFFNESGVAYDVRSDYAMLVHAKKMRPSRGVSPEVLRDKYREMLISGMNLGQLFYSLADFYKRLRFHSVIDLFLKAAGDDLAAVTNQTDQSFLGNLLKELGILKTLRSVFEGCVDVLEKTRRIFPNFYSGTNECGPNELMGELLGFCAKQTPTVEDGRKILKPFQIASPPPAAQVVFCNGLLDLHREVPDRSFPSAKARMQQINVLTAICSDLVEVEEQVYQIEKPWSTEAD